MITCVGDLVEDVIVLATEDLRPGTDVFTRIERHRGGSAANVAVAVCRSGGTARFVGNLGQDTLGDLLLADLASEGVELDVSRRGRTGSIVAIIDAGGERSFFTDRGSSSDVRSFSPALVSQSSAIHVPLYSLLADPLRRAVLDMAALAKRHLVPITLDGSSTAVIAKLGTDGVRAMLAEIAPSTLFCNAAEAEMLDVQAGGIGTGLRPAPVTIVKNGPDPTVVINDETGRTTSFPVASVPDVIDSTGAGDAFAGGYLAARYQRGFDEEGSILAAHDMARRSLSALGATPAQEDW